MRSLTALTAAALLPATLVTAPAPPAAATISRATAARAAATAEIPTYTPGVAGWPSGKGFDVAYRAATENVLYRRFVDGVWSSPLNVAGRLIGGPAVTFAGGNPRVYGRGVDGKLWERVRVAGTWQPWAKVDDLPISTSPAAAGHPDGRVEVFVRDATDRLRTKTYTPGTGWSAWTALDLTARSAPAVAVTGTDTVRVVATGTDNAVWTRTRTGTTWTTDVKAWVPGSPPGVPSALRGRNVTKIPTTSKVAALTFDCAWDAAGVPSIRATLQRENVPGTFFLVGDFARTFPIYSNLLAGSGFRIGNHSNTHPDFTEISDATATTQVTTARTAIFNADGAEPRPMFRFPYGAYTASDVTLLNGLGYVPVGWTVDSLGWQGTSGGQTADKVIARVLAAKTPGMIVLMHVGANPDDDTTLDADALPAIIQGLRGAGYSFTTLDALTR